MLPDFEREKQPLVKFLTIPDCLKEHFDPDLLQEMEQAQPKRHRFALALDLEGTLIDDVFDLSPRPNLSYFLSCCRSSFDFVVIFTAVDPPEASKAIEKLIGYHPQLKGLRDLPIIEWMGKDPSGRPLPQYELCTSVYKDLNFVYSASRKRYPWSISFLWTTTSIGLILNKKGNGSTSRRMWA